MKTISNPPKKEWTSLVRRPALELDYLDSTVRNILHRVKTSGDAALIELAQQFDQVTLSELLVTPAELAAAANALPDSLKQAIELAARNIETFHRVQTCTEAPVETMPGVTCWRRSVPIESVGIYVPGGSAPLFSTVLMLAVPARIAGCQTVTMCTPPGKDGTIHPAILYAASISGVTQIWKVGGAQAIAAMAYGTQSIGAVCKIFGPGNQFVTKAKQLINADGIAIDMPAGPSEVLVVADAAADPSFVAADLLAQAEHGADSQVVLLTNHDPLIGKVQSAIQRQLTHLPRQAVAQQALQNSLAIYFSHREDITAFSNAYAPEHLILNTADADVWSSAFTNAGSVFLGPYTPESAGDYASGTNHTLPTNGSARAFSGVSLDSFVKKITYQRISPAGLRNLGPAVEILAEAESLKAHKEAVSVRLKAL
ncbi:MAG: histidinol dehydrogenase [Cyclobacteriaceae bacterium]|nr:histidinol dehydrogenase [Cyclobacteriaceae bacterium]